MPVIKTRTHCKKKFLLGGIALVTIALTLNATPSQVRRPNASVSKAQSSWVKFSPPDRSFVVEAPRNLHRLEKSDLSDASFKCAKSAEAYELPLTSESHEHAFIIGVFKLSGCKCDQEKFKEEVKDLLLVIGGDNKRIISDVEAKVNGFSGREIVYENGDVNGRVLLVNTGKRAYLVMYTTDVLDKTSAPEILRIFKSFRPLRVSS